MEEIQLAASDKSALATVKAHSVGLLAVHRPITRSGGQDNRRSAGWTVTHKPTGFKACHVDGSLADAKKRARLLLACGIDWDTTDTDALSRAGRECAALREILSLRPARQAAPGASVSPKVGPVDLDAAMAAVEDDSMMGFCMACGEEVGGVEPDARGYECPSCQERRVFGAEQILLENIA